MFCLAARTTVKYFHCRPADFHSANVYVTSFLALSATAIASVHEQHFTYCTCCWFKLNFLKFAIIIINHDSQCWDLVARITSIVQFVLCSHSFGRRQAQ